MPWYAKFYVAEQRVRARMDAAKAALPAPPSAPAADPEELQQLRRRVAKLERMVLGKNAILLKVVGQALGVTHGEHRGPDQGPRRPRACADPLAGARSA